MADFEVLAEHSYGELLNVLEWFSNFGLIPVLVGGWAVFAYNSYFGSVDIDFVGWSMGGHFLDTIERYERVHGYEEVRLPGLGVEIAYRKPVAENNRVLGYIEIDVCTFEADTGGFHEEAGKKLPYSLCGDPELLQRAVFDEERTRAVAYVPRKSLLFLYKLKAFRDRSFDLRTKGAIMNVERREWLRTKVGKDGADLIALLDPEPERYVIRDEMDFDLVRQLVERQSLHFALESVKKLPTLRRSVSRHTNLDLKMVEKWVSLFFEKINWKI
jgi:hypothetical protein